MQETIRIAVHAIPAGQVDPDGPPRCAEVILEHLFAGPDLRITNFANGMIHENRCDSMERREEALQGDMDRCERKNPHSAGVTEWGAGL